MLSLACPIHPYINPSYGGEASCLLPLPVRTKLLLDGLFCKGSSGRGEAAVTSQALGCLLCVSGKGSPWHGIVRMADDWSVTPGLPAALSALTACKL